jgi:hypothetical protein
LFCCGNQNKKNMPTHLFGGFFVMSNNPHPGQSAAERGNKKRGEIINYSHNEFTRIVLTWLRCGIGGYCDLSINPFKLLHMKCIFLTSLLFHESNPYGHTEDPV